MIWQLCFESNVYCVQIILVVSMAVCYDLNRTWYPFFPTVHLKERLSEYISQHLPMVQLVRSKERLGLIRARMLGAKQATGDVRLFVWGLNMQERNDNMPPHFWCMAICCWKFKGPAGKVVIPCYRAVTWKLIVLIIIIINSDFYSAVSLTAWAAPRHFTIKLAYKLK